MANSYNTLNIPDELIETWERIAQPVALHDGCKCLYANQAFLYLLGLSGPEDVLDRNMAEFFAPWPSDGPRPGVRACLGRSQSGRQIDVEMTNLPFMLDDVIYYQCLVRDITELKIWEDKLLQSERLTAMGKLAGEIAHEINNPLGGILLYGNLIKEDLRPNSPARANVEKIIKLATRCRIIAKGLLSFGRSSQRVHALVNLNQVIKEMFSLVEDHKIFKGINVNIELDTDLPHIMADKAQMEQVVLNLIINAAEAMDGHGDLLIRTSFTKQPPFISLLVKDTGPGIPKEILSRIFEPFFTTKRPGRGTGLGLSITHGIVQRHGGRIQVNSKIRQGTRFTVILPYRDAVSGAVSISK